MQHNIFDSCLTNDTISKILSLDINKRLIIDNNFINEAFKGNIVNNSNLEIGTKCFCDKCKDETSFVIGRTDFINASLKFVSMLNSKKNTTTIKRIGDNKKIVNNDDLEDESLDRFEIDLLCPMCHRKMTLYYVYTSNYIEKIFTYPDVMDGYKVKYKEYRKLQTDNGFDYYNEFVEACYSFYKIHSGIGAFCYLRRCLENLVNDKIIEINEQYTTGMKFSEKISRIKDYINPEIYSMLSNLYGILSKGIHELDEEDCLTHFDTMKQIVEILLDQRLETIKERKKIASLKKSLNKISSKI